MHTLRKRADVDGQPAEPETEAPKESAQKRRAREFALDHREQIFRSEDVSPHRFRDLRPVTADFNLEDFLVSPLLSGSEFSGHSVHRANYRKFLADFGDLPGVFPLTGGYESFGIAVRLSAMDKKMLATFLSMDDYGSLDDEGATEIETKAIHSAWEDWARHDFISALEDKFPDLEPEIDSMTDVDLLALFEKLRPRTKAEWVHETGDRAYITVAAIAHACTIEDLPKVDHSSEEEKEEQDL